MKKWIFLAMLFFGVVMAKSVNYPLWQPIPLPSDKPLLSLKVSGVIATEYYNVLLPKGSKRCEDISQKFKKDFYRSVKSIAKNEYRSVSFRYGACYIINSSILKGELLKSIYKNSGGHEYGWPLSAKKTYEYFEKNSNAAMVANFFDSEEVGYPIEIYVAKNTEFGLMFSYFIAIIPELSNVEQEKKKRFFETFKPYMEGLL
jgi:hypothetical protein